MAETKIEWTATPRPDGSMAPGYTFNPWEGCTKVSAGCANCYAEARAERFGTVKWGPQGTRRVASETYWRQPLKWDREAREAGERRRVFCASLADVFEGEDTMPSEFVPAVKAARRRLFKLIGATPHLDWLLLTKRPQNIFRLTYEAIDPFYDPDGDYNAAGEPNGLSVTTFDELYPNVWLGASVEDQATADERIPHLLKIPATVRFLSVEPLLGAVDLRAYLPNLLSNGTLAGYWHEQDPATPRVRWVIVGGESGHGARPCDVEWVRSLVRQCKAAKVPCFVKQLGSNYEDPLNGVCGKATRWPLEILPSGPTRRLQDSKGGDPAEWPEDLRVRQFPEVRQ